MGIELILLGGAIVVHELGHYIVAKHYRLKAWFGVCWTWKIPNPCVWIIEDDQASNWKKTWLAIAGIEANFLYAEILFFLGFPLPAIFSLVLGISQMIPLFGSDGQKVATIWRRNATDKS